MVDLSHIDAIIFDNDGVLVDSEVILISVERELLAEMGLHYDDQTYVARFVGLSNADYFAALAQDYLTLTGDKFPADFSDQLRQRVWPRIEAELEAIPGVPALVERFGKRTAVASSAVLPRLNHKLKLTDLFDLFDPHIYSSDHVTNGKPAPDLFLHAAARVGVAPPRCLVIEDSVNGVKAGRRAEMLTAGFIGGGHVDEVHGQRLLDAGAHFVVNGHAELEVLF